MRKITEIIIHCAATRPEWMQGSKTSAKVAEIRRWHLGNGWSDIGYHYLIDRDGTVAKGRDVSVTGAHVKGRNTGTIGICLMGGHGSSETDAFSEHFTGEQDRALRKLIADLHKQFGPVEVNGHNQYAAKACPGFNAPKWFAMGKPPLADYVPPATEIPPAMPAWLAGIIAALSALFGKKG
jgi:hypothetical protein